MCLLPKQPHSHEWNWFPISEISVINLLHVNMPIMLYNVSIEGCSQTWALMSEGAQKLPCYIVGQQFHKWHVRFVGPCRFHRRTHEFQNRLLINTLKIYTIFSRWPELYSMASNWVPNLSLSRPFWYPFYHFHFSRPPHLFFFLLFFYGTLFDDLLQTFGSVCSSGLFVL